MQDLHQFIAGLDQIDETTLSHALYQSRVQELRKSRYLKYPKHVHIETMALCNAACTFCPYPHLERQKTVMPDELISKILDDLTEIPPEVTFHISPFKVNEPFLDWRLFDVMRQINAKLPNAAITLTSNATPLTDEKLDRLQTIANIGYLWISFNDHRPGEYEKTMSLPYERTMERLKAIHARIENGEIVFPVHLSRVGDETSVDNEFCQWVKKTFPRFQSKVFQRGGWIGQVDTTIGRVPNVGCSRWFELSITATGIVAHCCMDGQAKWPIGDVTNQSVLEVYNHPAYRTLRERITSRLTVAPCNRCTFF